MTVHTCALTGHGITTKAYILKTTEGEEIISPEALLHPDADANLGLLITELAARVEALEAALEAAKPPLPKRTPGQRKAAD